MARRGLAWRGWAGRGEERGSARPGAGRGRAGLGKARHGMARNEERGAAWYAQVKNQKGTGHDSSTEYDASSARARGAEEGGIRED